MEKIEYIARALAKLDGIQNPDQLAIDVRIQPWQNQMVRLVDDSPSLTAPAWQFYAREAELVLKFSAEFDAEGAS